MCRGEGGQNPKLPKSDIFSTKCRGLVGGVTDLGLLTKNIAKGTTDPRVEFCLPKYLVQVISQDKAQILIKFDLRNLDQASNYSISTKLKFQNLVQT